MKDEKASERNGSMVERGEKYMEQGGGGKQDVSECVCKRFRTGAVMK